MNGFYKHLRRTKRDQKLIYLEYTNFEEKQKNIHVRTNEVGLQLLIYYQYMNWKIIRE